MIFSTSTRLARLVDRARELSRAIEQFSRDENADSPEERHIEVDRQIAARHPTIPMVMGVEKAANPFLRADVPSVAKAVGLPDAPAWQVFAELRARKDKF